MSWADMTDTESPAMPPLVDESDHGELGDEHTECDANSDFLYMEDMEEEEDDSSFLPH